MTENPTVITFCLGTAHFALPVAPVLEILEVGDIAPLPRTPPALLGLIDRHGVSVPVIDLRIRLGMPGTEPTDDTRVIVLRAGVRNDRNLTVGVRVDRVIEVTELDGAVTEPLSEAELLHWQTAAVRGIGRRNDHFVTLLDIDGLFAEDIDELNGNVVPDAALS
ncbi:chemotaxis protein CheW [Loktanella sp. DJP18]|uniref:chemotaxis protein CheW n=1 Tax=Loktanella sp. DJP18 TaxID=3409788 RepID=UPI003BB6D998